MTLDLTLDDLSRLDRIRDVLQRNDPNDQFAALDMEEVRISDSVLDELIAVVEYHLGRADRAHGLGANVCMMCDPVTIKRGSQDLKALVEDSLSGAFALTKVVLDDGQPILHADEAVLDAATERSVGADAIVSVGGGTITDIAKIAAERNGIPVHVVVQTAASVDGFTDNFSVVLQNGVKTTLRSRWPQAVLTDTQVVAAAPQYLNASGFGELVSMYSAPGDWYLANQLGMDPKYAPVLLDLLVLCGGGVEEWSGGIRDGQPASTTRLATALAMRGIVTGVGGTTASLSGMEHLVSHMLDMVGGELNEPTGLHGAQVGVGSVIRAAAWEEFRDRRAAERLDTATLFAAPASYEAEVKDAFTWLDPNGKVGTECWGRFSTKLTQWHAARDRIKATLADWDTLQANHDEKALGSHQIAKMLHKAGAPKRFSDLDPTPSAARMNWVVANCQFMRERFTVADLLKLAGWWEEADVARVMARVEEACAAAEAEE